MYKRQVHISTKEAYVSIIPKKANFDLKEISSLQLDDWQSIVTNDFEAALLPKHQSLQDLRKDLLQLNPFYCAMSGSGSTFFALFKEKPKNVDFGNYPTKLVAIKF